MSSEPLKFIDLFAGLGGFHYALKQLGCKCVFASEIRADLQQLYLRNFPDTNIHGDITRISPADIPPHDILCAGFPCQPFSQAGKREGFKDEERGNLFYNICNILEYHKPKYLLLENVANLMGHDGGNTWNIIKTKLTEIGYGVKSEILSPHQFGIIPQHRKRIYIVGILRDKGNIDNYQFPQTRPELQCDINKIIDINDTNIQTLKPEIYHHLSVWQEFIDHIIENNDRIPQFPIWAMEFGATYDYLNKVPAHQRLSEINGKRGAFGHVINGSSLNECLAQIPNYARTGKDEHFPKWKNRYIEQNREFYRKHKKWLDRWLPKIESFKNSHQKFEWNCGIKASPTLEDKIIQYRASGIRVKLPTFIPALNLVGTQIPIFPWVQLPNVCIVPGQPTKGRFLSVKEAAKLQGLHNLDFDYTVPGYPLSVTRIFEALGNAVNATLVKHIAKRLICL